MTSLIIGLILAALAQTLPAPASTSALLTLYSCTVAMLFFGGSTGTIRGTRFLIGITLSLELLGQQRLGLATLIGVSTLIVSNILSEHTRITTRQLRFLTCSLLVSGAWILASSSFGTWRSHLGPLVIANCIGMAVTYLSNRSRSLSTELIQ